MTYDEAVKRCKAGAAIRHPGMSKGWVIRWLSHGGGLFNINPHTGSDYLFRADLEELRRQDWIVVP